MEPRSETTILLVEDEDIARGVLADVLRHAGYDVIEAKNALDAFSVDTRGAPIHLIVTDIMMPGIDGLQLLQRFRGRYPAIRVLVISGNPDFEGPIDSLERTPTAFLGKPFNGYDLLHTVEWLLHRPPD